MWVAKIQFAQAPLLFCSTFTTYFIVFWLYICYIYFFFFSEVSTFHRKIFDFPNPRGLLWKLIYSSLLFENVDFQLKIITNAAFKWAAFKPRETIPLNFHIFPPRCPFFFPPWHLCKYLDQQRDFSGDKTESNHSPPVKIFQLFHMFS